MKTNQTNGNTITVICDNGGGITLQIITPDGDQWQHSYEGSSTEAMADQAATDIRNAMAADFDLSDWEGNQVDDCGWCEPTDEEIRNGGYRVESAQDLLAADPDDNHGYARSALIAALRK
jgi:hypothetical protein